MIEPNTPYDRKEDMSPVGFLRVIMQLDGDMIVAVVPDPHEIAMGNNSIEFCASGGRSPHTLKALRELAEAIDRDNRGVPFEIDIRAIMNDEA